MKQKIDRIVAEKANKWLEGAYDEKSKREVREMMERDPEALADAFYKDLEFGTGGLRGIMGAGTNRMNVYTVGMATQGLANYLRKNFGEGPIKVVVGHDSRHNSRAFAEHVADIFASNGFTTYLFDALRPTPELSYAIRHLGCKSGVNITASHNPKEYNGYKAYWDDGSQVTAPHDKNIIAEVAKITDISQILTGRNPENIHIIGEEVDRPYLEDIYTLALAPEAVRKHHDMKIVYSPMHGAGVAMVPASLRRWGFTNVSVVKEQAVLDGDFPTVKSPNPEERATMKMAIDLGIAEKADLITASDPDCDRIALALPDDDGEIVLLNGNQTCVLLTYYICRRWKENGRLDGNQYIVKTIVTSDMMARVAESFGVECCECLTGFKYIAEIIRNNEGTAKKYIGGGEESFGYLPEDFARDKDAVSSISLAAECAAWAKEMGMTMNDLLKQMYMDIGFYLEDLVSVVRKGREGADEIKQMMTVFRSNPPKYICGSPVVTIRDFQSGETLNVATGAKTPITIERSNVLQFFTREGWSVSVRPSGTEPKIKFYFSVNLPLPSADRYDEVHGKLEGLIAQMKREFGLE